MSNEQKMREALKKIANSICYQEMPEIAREALADQSVQGEAVRQYYFQTHDCTTRHSTDAKCICWHDAGTGPASAAREGDEESFCVTLTWRDKPAPPAPEMPK